MQKTVLLLTTLLLGCGLHIAKDRTWTTGAMAITWDHAPMFVWADPNIDKEALATAVNLWNSACKLLVITNDTDRADIMIHVGAHKNTTTAAGTTEKATTHVKIFLYTAGSVTSNYLLLAHELGHALGLATDETKYSIMSDYASGDMFSMNKSLPSASYNDLAALKQRYCQ